MEKMPFDYRGKGAVVTGAASGIGLAMARELAMRGASVMLSDVDDGALIRARGDIETIASGRVESFRCDVADAAAVARLSDAAFACLPGVHFLFNNAGVGVSGPIEDMGERDWQWVLGVNLWGAINGVDAFLPRMRDQRQQAHILFNASFAGLVYDANMGPYCVSKAGVVALAEVLGRELQAGPIGVSVVCPMRVDTEIGSSARNRAAADLAASRSGEVTDPRDSHVPGTILSAEDAVLRILDAVDHRELHIMTHGDGRDFLRKRFARIDRVYSRQHPETDR